MPLGKPNPNKKKNSKTAERKKSSVDLTEGKWSSERHSVESTAKEGCMCQVSLKTTLQMTPKQLFGIFSSPDNSHIFRDLGKTVKYKVTEMKGSKQTISLEQQAVLKFLAIPFKFSTFLFVDLDYEELTMDFRLAKWGAMKKFEGGWTMKPVLEGDKVVGCVAEMTQDVLPIIVPPFLKDLLTGVSTNVVRRLLEDLDAVALRLANGEPMPDILGTSKWVEKNDMLKAWRKEMDAEWAMVDNTQDKKAAGSDLDSAQESKPPSEGKNEDECPSGSEKKDSAEDDIQTATDTVQGDDELNSTKLVDAASESTKQVEI